MEIIRESKSNLTPDDFQLVIPMSGIGSRFIAKGYTVPKFLIPVEGKTVIEHVLDMYPGFEDVLFIINESHANDENLKLTAFLQSLRKNVKVRVIPNHKLGPSWAVHCAKEDLDDTKVIVVNYCDFTCLWDLKDLYKLAANDLNNVGLIACYTGFQPHYLRSTHYAFVKTNENNLVLELREKEPYTNDPTTEWGSSGTYVFKNSDVLINAIDQQIDSDMSKFGEFFTSLTYLPLIQEGKKIEVLPLRKFMQWGTPEDFADYLYYSSKLKDVFLTPERKAADSLVCHTIILAAGKGARFKKEGYLAPKMELMLGSSSIISTLIEMQDNSVKVFSKTGTLSDDSVKHIESLGAEIQFCQDHPSSQVDSCIQALNTFGSRDNLMINILSCDSVLRFNSKDMEHANSFDSIVWVSEPNPSNSMYPSQTSWVDYDDENKLARSFAFKTEPHNYQNAKALTGVFSFKNSRVGLEILGLLKELKPINGEHYLDQMLELIAVSKYKIGVFHLNSFLSLGTPAEYESARYWLETFQEWPAHDLYQGNHD